MVTHEQMAKLGYDQEEEYFYKLNRDLIDQNRRERDQKAVQVMKCPNCGGKMGLHQVSGIQVSHCAQCQGVFFKSGEFETLMGSREHGAFFNLLKKLFAVKKDYPVFF